MKIEETSWLGEAAISLSAGGYEALLIPGVGANIIKLINIEKEVDILRTPENLADFKERPQVYGLPLLFPPNRIEDGTYTVNDKTYTFPINDIAKNNHIHGFIRTMKFNVIRQDFLDNLGAVEIELNFISDAKNNAIYSYFPHEFECRVLFKLSDKGLEQKVSFINNSSTPMPLGVGYHTAFNIPFYKGSKRDDYKVIVSVDKRMELNSRNLPTGNFIALNSIEEAYRKDGMMPFEFPLDTAYTGKHLEVDGQFYNGAILIDTNKNIKVYYEVGKDYKHWTLWNSGGNVNFFCPEPQTWSINAPNLNLSDDVTGFKLLNPEEMWSEISKIYVK